MEFIKKYIGIVVAVIVAVAYVIGFLSFPIDPKDKEAFDFVSVHLVIAKYLVYMLLLLCIGFFAIKVVNEPKRGLRFGIGAGSLTLLFFITYLMAGDEEGSFRLVEAMISTTIALLFIGGGILAAFIIKQKIENAKA